MGGLAGLLYFDAARPLDGELLDRMTDALAHRGPDGRQVRVAGAFGLGHRRLAAEGPAPAAEAAPPDAPVWVATDGELCGAAELRAELEAAGHRFRSGDAAEVLARLYAAEGEAMVERLRGAVAFALWDAGARRLLLVRDRFGERPLVYRRTPEALHFGSEARAILQDPAVPREADPRALSEFLAFGYVPGPLTAFRGVRELPPGHLLTVEADGRSELRAYWRLRLQPKLEPSGPRGEAEAVGRLGELLDEAVRLRAGGEPAPATLLSGDLGASAVAASLRAAAGGGAPIRTLGLAGAAGSAEAARVARHLGAEHAVLPRAPDAAADLERVAWRLGDPCALPAAWTAFAAARAARARGPVVLTGDGGEELFCSRRRYVGTRIDEVLRAAEGPRLTGLRRAVRSRALIGLLRRAGWAGLADELALDRAAGRAAPPSDLYAGRVEAIPPALRNELVSDELRAATRGRDPRDRLRRAIASSAGDTFTERCAHADLLTRLPGGELAVADAAAAACGLVRHAPLLDHVLAEHVARLPFRLKMRRLETHLPLARALAGRLPADVLARRGRATPPPRVRPSWLPARPADVLLDPRALGRGLLRPAVVRRLVDEHAAGRADHTRALLSLLALEAWHRVWVDPPQGSALERPPAVSARGP